MREYIDREAALQSIQELWCDNCETRKRYATVACGSCGIGDVADMIDCFPAADVVEVVHGEWEYYFEGKELMCSACKATFWDDNGHGGTNFCPNCGAKMDGERKEDETN